MKSNYRPSDKYSAVNGLPAANSVSKRNGLPTVETFEEYCKRQFRITYLAEIRRLITENDLPIGKTSKSIPEPDEIDVCGIEIKNIKFGTDQLIDPRSFQNSQTSGYPFTINTRSTVIATMKISETWDKHDFTDTIQQWYQIDGHIVFYPDRQEYHPMDTISIYDKDTSSFKYALNENLVPYIGNDDLDNISTQILAAFYPEALRRPTHVKAKKLAAKLGLTIMPARLSRDNSRFGLLVMHDCYLMIDGVMTFVPGKTILIDREACNRKRGGRIGIVIIHECIHFILHRAFYKAQILYQAGIPPLYCGKGIESSANRDLHWVDWQANHLTPRVMIPAETAYDFIDQELNKICLNTWKCKESSRFEDYTPFTDHACDNSWDYTQEAKDRIFQKLIPIVSSQFYTSWQCTKIRLKELGYDIDCSEQTDARGTDWADSRASDSEYERDGKRDDRDYNKQDSRQDHKQDNHYNRKDNTEYHDDYSDYDDPSDHQGGEISPHIQTSQTGPLYKIALSEVLETVRSDRRLLKALNSGRYVYVDSRFCLNDPIYITHTPDGSLRMNEYALSHEGECCLPFWIHNQYGTYIPGFFHSKEITGTQIVYGSEAKVQKRTVSEIYPRMQEVIETLPASVGGTVVAHMKRLDCTEEDLEEYAHISRRTISKIRTNKCSTLEMRYFVAICIGLKLEPPYSLDLMNKTRYRFDTSREATMYLILLTTMYAAGIDACNEECVKNELPPLTR